MLRKYILENKFDINLRDYIINYTLTGGSVDDIDIVPMCVYTQQFKEDIFDSRGFSLGNAEEYFIKRLQEIKKDKEPNVQPIYNRYIDELSQLAYNIRNSNDPIQMFNSYMNIIKEKVFIINNNNQFVIDWDHLPMEHVDEVYLYREYIITLSLLTAEQIFRLYDNSPIKIGMSPERTIIYNKANAIIMGSLSLFSDIDITIQSKNASLWISILEDLWVLHDDWFDHELWKVDLYGDFTQIGNYYIDTHYFSKKIIINMLILSVCSFLRNNLEVDRTLLKKLVEWCIDSQGLFTTYDKIERYAEDKINALNPDNREMYYYKLSEAEHLQEEIKEKFKENDMSNELNNLLGECIISLGEANLYRQENYVLTSTVIYIVKIEQGKEIKNNKCDPLYTAIANCSLGLYTYILSAIEQLGYMLHKEHETGLGCSLSEGKYFGRFIRSIGHANHSNGILSTMIENPRYRDTLDIISEIESLKKLRGKEGNNDITCPFNYNLYEHALELFENN